MSNLTLPEMDFSGKVFIKQPSYMDNGNFKYYAFISYKSEDVEWAKWLQRRLERYSLPVTLQQKHKLPKHLTPVFRDGSDIRPRELKNELAENLEQSRYLIVLCSPRSASSDWVGKEIDQFCQMGRRSNIIALIIDGKPYSDDPATECYHPTLRKWFPKGETVATDHQLLGADIHAAGPESGYYKRERAFMQVLSVILQISFDELWNRRKRQIVFHSSIYTLAAIAVAAALLFTWMRGRPFDVKVTLNEATVHNSELPFRDGTLYILSGNDTLGVRPVSAIDEPVVFSNIAGKFNGKPTRLVFRMFGYETIDTTLSLGKSHGLSIRRDDTFGIFAGQVIDDDGNPVPDVSVAIGSHVDVTDASGIFFISLPVGEQSQQQHIVLTKTGYQNISYDLQPQRDHNLIIFRE